MSNFDFKCKRCGAAVLPDETCTHGNCQDCRKVCCEDFDVFCTDPNCTCRMNFKNFRPTISRQDYEFTK